MANTESIEKGEISENPTPEPPTEQSSHDESEDEEKVSPLTQQERTELLAEPKRDPIDKSIIPRPSFVVPEIYLPGWCLRPLFSKIPAKSDPWRPVIFSRPKLGKSLHLSFKDKDFDTSPVVEIPLEYNPFHDPHLARHYRLNEKNYWLVAKNGWVNPFSDYVVCNQADFNFYRDYVRSLMVREENQRRREEEDKIQQQKLERQEDELMKLRNQSLLWLRQVLLSKKKHNIKIVEELVPKKDETGEGKTEDEEAEEYSHEMELMRIQKEEHSRRMTNVGELFQKNLRRIIGFDERKENKIKERKQKGSDMWKKMAEEEIGKLKDIRELRKRQRALMKQDIDKREEKYQRIRDRDKQRLKELEQRKKEKRKKEPKEELEEEPKTEPEEEEELLVKEEQKETENIDGERKEDEKEVNQNKN